MTGGAAPGQPDEALLLRRCHENFVETFRSVARGTGGGRIEEEPGAVFIASGLPRSAFNPVFVTQPPQDPARTLEHARSFMSRSGVRSWALIAFPESAPLMSAAAAQAGLPPPTRRPGMLLAPIPSKAPPLPPGLRIRRAITRPLWGKMVRVALEGFGATPPEDADEFLPYVDGGRARGYVGFVQGKPVATSVGFSHVGVCGVFFVATLPEYRGKGYGAALTWRATMEARREGCRVGYLQASEMGYPVYTKMGYRQVAEYLTWQVGTPPPAAPSQ